MHHRPRQAGGRQVDLARVRVGVRVRVRVRVASMLSTILVMRLGFELESAFSLRVGGRVKGRVRICCRPSW